MFGSIYALVRFAPLAIFLFVAVAGAFLVLVASSAGWADVTEFGKFAAGGGAVGFFAWLFLPAFIRAL